MSQLIKKIKIKSKIKAQSLYNFFLIILYKAILELSYFCVISKVWSYKLSLNFSVLKLFESYFLLFIIYFLMPKNRKKLSSITSWLLILISYIPILVLFSAQDQPRIYVYSITIFWVFVFLLLKLATPKIPFFKKNQSKTIFYCIVIILGGLTFAIIYKYFGWFLNFNLGEVYDIRANFRAAKIPIIGYFIYWICYVVNPTFFAYFLIHKKWHLLGLMLFLQIFIASITGFRAFYFVLPFVLFLIWVSKYKNLLGWIILGICLTIVLSLVFYYLSNNILFISLFTRRTLFTPANLSFTYYNFFSEHQHVFLSYHAFFQKFLDYPYKLKPGNLIGKTYFNNPTQNACNGIYADAYMNFGFLGFMLWGFLLATILKIMDAFSRNKNKTIAVAAIATTAIYLTNGAFMTALLTKGLALSLIILYLLPTKNNE